MYPAVFRYATYTGALLVFSVATANAQQSTLSNVSFSPCCIAADGHGNNFVVGSGSESSVAVAKVVSGRNVIRTSSFAFRPTPCPQPPRWTLKAICGLSERQYSA